MRALALCIIRYKGEIPIYEPGLQDYIARNEEAGTVGNVRVIDYAVQPSWPIAPRKMRIMLLSLLLGGFAGVATAYSHCSHFCELTDCQT